MSIIIVEPKKAAPEERGKEKVMAQKTASPYQTNGLTFQAPRPEKGGTNATVKRGNDIRVKGGKGLNSILDDLFTGKKEDPKPEAEEKPAPEEEKPAPKPRTAEEAKKIREEAKADVRALREAFPELSGLRGLGELQDPTKYLAYRKKGLTAEEAYTLTYAGARRQQSAGGTTKPQLRSSPSGGAGSGTVLSAKETREISAQTGLTPDEIKNYYKKYPGCLI